MNPKISVLVPVYNVEKTLDRCMESILNQTFKDFEVIMVDDGSTDSSGAICDKYAEKYDFIRVIHKNNEGLGPTRDAGVLAAKGEYIYHCDSDDWLKEDLLEKAYNAITENNADVVIFGYDMYDKKDLSKLFGSVSIDAGVYIGKDEVRRLFVKHYHNAFIVLTAWNRLYKRSFLIDNELFFPALRRCQDMAYSLLLFDKIEKLVCINENLYCYVIEPGTFKGRSYEEMKGIYYTVYELVHKQYEQWGFLDEEQESKLIGRYCEDLATYSAYAFAVKYHDKWKECADMLLSDESALRMFAQYKNTKNSRFMQLFCLGVKLKSKPFLLAVSKVMQKKQK